MALITCSECGKEISDMAQSCPNCGKPVQTNQQTTNAQNTHSIQQNMLPPQTPRKKGHGCLITVIIIFLMFGGLGVAISAGIKDMEKHPEKYNNSITAKYIDVSNEQSIKIDSILKECGLPTIKSFEHDSLLDNAHFEGETGYRIAVNGNVDNIVLYLDADKNVYSLKYAGYDLYLDNTVIATLQDYTFTSEEMSKLMVQCQSTVEEILKSPSTAKFPNILNWGFGKEKNIVTVQGYVDSQNGFGAEIRSTFQFIIDTDTNTIKSFIFDGQELVIE